MKTSLMVPVSLLLLILVGNTQPANSFPELLSVITTRDVATQNSAQWDIQLQGSRRLREIDEEMVDLRVVVHRKEDLDHLDWMKESGLLVYEKLNDEVEDFQRHLLGINETLFCYRTVDETYASLEEFASLYPALVTVGTIGQSFLKQQNKSEGYDIKVLVITASDSPVAPEDKVDMMLVGGHHSRELAPPETLMRWAEHLLSSYGMDPDITWILDRTNIHIVPIANPDGRKIVQDHLDWMRRKNGRPTDCDLGPIGYGVDLNRNYPMFWGDENLNASSADQCADDYHGTGPLSEPESAAVFAYSSALFDVSMKKGTPEEAMSRDTEACPTNATGMFIDVHAYGDFVYFPWGYKDEACPNHLPFLTMSGKLSKPGNLSLWGPEQDGFLYFVAGDASDATYGVDCIFSFGCEIGSQFYASCDELESSIVPTMFESLLYAARCVSAPYLLPLGPDVMMIDVNSKNAANVTIVVEVSDGAMIVEHSIYSNELNRSQPIAQVQVFVDEHPLDAPAAGILLEPRDGAFDSPDEVAVLTMDLSDLQGRHVLYFQAKDSHGYVGPVFAVFVELGGEPGLDPLNHSSVSVSKSMGGSVVEDLSSTVSSAASVGWLPALVGIIFGLL